MREQSDRRQGDALIAVIETEVKQIMAAQKDHQIRDDKIFDTVFELMDKNHIAVINRIAESEANMKKAWDEKIQKLWDERNQRAGAIKFSGFLSHCITAIFSVGSALGIMRFFK
jgi:hypothetical protein